MQTNDELWQGALEDFATDFIQKFYPDLYPWLDPDKPIEFLDKVLMQLHPESNDTRRVVDKLMKVHLKGTTPMIRYLYIHAEAQGYPDDKFDERNFIYFYRLFDRLKGNITVKVLYTSDDKAHQPSSFRYYFYGTEVIYKFPIFIIADQDPKLLEASDNLFDTVLLTAYWAIQRKKNLISEEDMLDLKLDLMRRLLTKNVDKDKIRRLLIFIKSYLRFENPDNKLIFEQKYDELLNVDKKMGILEIVVKQEREEARQEALTESREALTESREALTEAQELLRKNRKNAALSMRKLNFSAEKTADVLSYPLEEVVTYFKEADAETAL
jgi:hypothetical protein